MWEEAETGCLFGSAHLKGCAEHGSFKAWLGQQTRWRIADQLRKRDKFAPGPGPMMGSQPMARDEQTGTATINRIPDPATLDTDAGWDAEWEKHQLKVALERLKARVSVKQFQMFDLHALQGLSAKEAARAMGASVMAVHMATSRLRRLLGKEIATLNEAERPG